MKKLISFLLVISLCLSLSACSKNELADSDSSDNTSQTVITNSESSNTSSEASSSINAANDSSDAKPITSSKTDSKENTISDKVTSNEKKPSTMKKEESTQTNSEEQAPTNSSTSSTQSKPTASEETEKPQTSSNTSRPSKEPEPIEYENFSHDIGVYIIDNVEKTAGSNQYYAYLSLYTLENSESTRNAFKEKFASSFGFEPTAKIFCKTLGTYKVEEYDEPKVVYQLYINDDTYRLLLDEFFIIKRKICADGSPWVGFPVPYSMDNMYSSTRMSELLPEMNKEFCEWTGYDMNYLYSHKDKFCVNYVGEGGKMRTLDGRVTDVVYRYTRGVNIPV